MEMRTRQLVMIFALILVGVPVLWAVFEAAPHEVAVGVSVAAIAALVGYYVYAGVVVLREARRGPGAAEDDEARKAAIRGRLRYLMPMVIGVPMLVFAAHPWGIASVVVGFAALILCQFLFLHITLAAGFILQRRSRRAA